MCFVQKIPRITNLGIFWWLGCGHSPRYDIIASREDLYDYLISLKIDSKISFQIADYISKGKKEHLNEILEYLKTYKVNDYYLDIFSKITYLPYKAHLISYINSYLEFLKYKDNDIKNFKRC